MCLCDLQRPFAVTQTGVMNSVLMQPVLQRLPHQLFTSFRMWCSFTSTFVQTHVESTHKDTSIHTYKHAQTRTCVYHWGSSAFNPSRLVSGGNRVQGPCPLYWSHWTWGELPHKGLSSERRHIWREWKVNGSKKKIDRGHSGIRQGNKKNWVGWRGFRAI